jgi:Flp pilus assembly protein TadD
MIENDKALERVTFISIAGTNQRRIGDFALDPEVPLPLELPPGQSQLNLAELRWEAIVAGALKVLTYDPQNAHLDYYRRFVLAVKPDIKEELTHLGITTSRNGDTELAIEIFRALEGLFPEDGIPKMNLALAYDEGARRQEKLENTGLAEELQSLAFEAYKRALVAMPSEPVIHYNFAFFYLHQRAFEKTHEHLMEYLKAGTDPVMMKEAGRIIKEIDSQGLIGGLFQKAYDFIRMGKEQEGVDAIRDFLDTHPRVPNAWFLLGWGLRRLGRYAEGKEAFGKALEAGAPHADLLNELAICHMELGELDASVVQLSEALRLEPENTKIITNMGIVAMKRDDIDEAKGFFLTVLEMDPKDPVARHYLDLLKEKKES